MESTFKTCLTGTFAGGNPQLPVNIIDSGGSNFIIKPECESDSLAYKFRLDVNLYNPSNKQTVVNIMVDWQDPSRDYLRTALYCSNKNRSHYWQYFQGKVVQGGVSFILSVDTGNSKISASPRYDYTELSQLVKLAAKVENIRVDTFYSESLTESIHTFLLQRHPDGNRPLILVTGRCHPYETAGSYCLDGVIRKFIDDEDWRNLLLNKFDFLLIPILAVNGVSRGYCRFNGIGDPGIDLGRQWNDEDAVCEIVRKIVGQYTVAGYLELHNWMHPDIDGIMYSDIWRSRRFVNKLNSYGVTTKKFRNRFRYGVLSAKTSGVLNWIKCNSKATCLAVEYPWYGRTVEQMRELGAATIETFAATL